ncbi:MFS general substrate transporter [Fomitiporia mediterranea MF3/22]|uniref:MFS general substrate transporter n=1 Tax=Fomitiporia mediterranea (strain MF3/22) TaxID=694068 RepID=UPI000440862E|nr:MFS general substrate transporter [Fomitiporia mediterranea MF3/22]EJD05439.1 MFS general substrate transporter [Fomitiporia mediterranea MF3/22]
MSSPLLRSQSGSNLRRIESAPLLTGGGYADQYLYGTVDDETVEEAAPQNKRDVTPLPARQISLLCLMRMANPIAYSQIFPYINEMMEDIGVVDHVAQVGYYSGLVDSTFAFVQLFTCLRLGMLADRWGRKPMLLIGLAGVALCTILFGMAKSFIFAVATRAVAGALAGNSMIINSSVGDITDESNQAQAYAWIGLSYNVASIVGPAIGGSFAKPEVTFPNTFGKIWLLQEYPYLLPCLITSLVAIIAFILCALFFKETVVRRPVLKQVESSYSAQDVSSEALAARDLSTWQLALDPVLFYILREHFILNILDTCSSVVFTLFAYTPIQHGGLSRNPREIGFAVALSGVLSGTVEVIFLAPLQRQFGVATLLKCTMSLWPLVFLSFPFTHLVARLTLGDPTATDMRTQPAGVAVWTCIFLQLLLQRVAAMAYPLNLILTRNAVPSDEILATVFGLSQLISSSARTVGPAFINSLFAFSKEHYVLGGNLVWLVMVAISLLGMLAAMKVRDGRRNLSEDDIPE